MKQLIHELSTGTISLSQALTRTKVIAFHLDNDSFKAWLKKELEGYDYDDVLLPDYRKIRIVNHLRFSLAGQLYSNPVTIAQSNEKLHDTLQFHQVTESIAVLTKLLENLSNNIQMEFLPEQAQILYGIVEKRHPNEKLLGGYMEASKGQFENIFENTKQKLLETLLELQKAFPDLTENEIPNFQNKEVVNNIVTTNIYGGNNPLNIATGLNVELRDITSNFSSHLSSELLKLGVEKSDIVSLENIIHQNKTDKPQLSSKIFKWLGNVSSALAARGLYDKLPALNEFIHHTFFAGY